ncbi:hypothetical protein [Ciceribacter selenitireducens]
MPDPIFGLVRVRGRDAKPSVSYRPADCIQSCGYIARNRILFMQRLAEIDACHVGNPIISRLGQAQEASEPNWHDPCFDMEAGEMP